MKAWSLAAVVLCCAVSSVYGQAPEAPVAPGPTGSPVKPINLNAWAVGSYNPNYTGYCVTCYGGSGCGKRGKVTGPGCGLDIWGVECPCMPPGIETCRKCGFFGRILFYECRRLACNQEGGQGCSWKNDCGDGCGSCGGCGPCGGCHKGHLNDGLLSWLEDFRARPLGGTASLTGPYRTRFNAFGWREGPMSYYGPCVGSYESYLDSPYDARGPLNGNFANYPAAGHGQYDAEAVDVEVPAAPTEAPVKTGALRRAPTALKAAPRVSAR